MVEKWDIVFRQNYDFSKQKKSNIRFLYNGLYNSV